MEQITLKSHAKINLSLDVQDLRQDHYHNISSVMQSIELHDRLTIRRKDEPFSMDILNLDLKPDSNNLVYKACLAICEYTGIPNHVHITLEKNIPIAAGLAGGSTDAAGALVGMDKLFKLNLNEKELFILALKVGSDVPFCLYGGTFLAEGRGEVLTKIQSSISGRLLIYKPPISVSTAHVYNKFDSKNVKERPNNQSLIVALEKGCLESGFPQMINVLESVTMNEYPLLIHARQRLLEAGSHHVMMTGSGPTLIAFVQNTQQERQVLQRAVELGGAVFTTKFSTVGQEIEG